MFKYISLVCVCVVTLHLVVENIRPERKNTTLRSQIHTYLSNNNHVLPDIGMDTFNFTSRLYCNDSRESGISTSVSSSDDDSIIVSMTVTDNNTMCTMQSDIRMKLLPVLIETRTVTKTTIIGTEPCQCGLLFCYSCPIIQETTERIPIYKSYQLTLNDYKGLYTFAAQHALEQLTDRVLLIE